MESIFTASTTTPADVDASESSVTMISLRCVLIGFFFKFQDDGYENEYPRLTGPL